MSVLERERQSDLPPAEPPDPDFWDFHEREFRPLQAELYPKDHLVGRVTLEECVSAAEARFERGLPLDRTEQDLLNISQEFVHDIYDEAWPEYS